MNSVDINLIDSTHFVEKIYNSVYADNTLSNKHNYARYVTALENNLENHMCVM